MLYIYFDLLQRNPLSAPVFLTEFQGVSPAISQAFESACKRFVNGLR